MIIVLTVLSSVLFNGQTLDTVPQPNLLQIAQRTDARGISFAGLMITDVRVGTPLSSEGCAAIAETVPGSPAAKSSFLAGDVVETIDGKSCASPAEFAERWKEHRQKDESSVFIVVRHQGSKEIHSLPWSEVEEVATITPRVADPPPTFAGLTLDDIPWERVPGGDVVKPFCAKITSVEVGSDAQKAGIEIGAIIETIGGLSCRSVEQFARLWDRKKTNTLYIKRPGGPHQYVAVRD
jgi:S1-C subfamily serine protease